MAPLTRRTLQTVLAAACRSLTACVVLLFVSIQLVGSMSSAAQATDSSHHGGHHHHAHGSGGGYRSHDFGGSSFGGGWGRSWRGNTSVTIITPGYFSSFGVGSFTPGWGSYNPGWGGFGGFVPYGYGWGSTYFPYPYLLPPVVVPAGELYGPRALWNQLGVATDGGIPGVTQFNAAAPFNGQGALRLPDPVGPAPMVRQANPAPQVAAVNNPQPAAAPVAAAAARPIKLRKANDASRGRALRMLALADEDFRAQKYAEAASRYRRAAQTAPDLAEAHFRQGQAEIALSRYESAAKSCKRGLDADPAWISGAFRLANLYGQNQAAKTAHIEQLAQEATAHPRDGDLRFLIGIELFLDGQLERSRKFFEQAAALNAGDDVYLLAFLRELDRQAPVPRAEAVDL